MLRCTLWALAQRIKYFIKYILYKYIGGLYRGAGVPRVSVFFVRYRLADRLQATPFLLHVVANAINIDKHRGIDPLVLLQRST